MAKDIDMNTDNFHDALVRSAEEAQKVVGHYAARFYEMLKEKGAMRTATELILRPRVTDGLIQLWKEERLDLSVEAVVLSGPWKSQFSDEVLGQARRRLKELKYDFDEYRDN